MEICENCKFYEELPGDDPLKGICTKSKMRTFVPSDRSKDLCPFNAFEAKKNYSYGEKSR